MERKTTDCFLVIPHVRSGRCTFRGPGGQIQKNCMWEKTLVSASLNKVTLWGKVSMRSVPGLNFSAWQRRAPWGGGWHLTEGPSPLSLPLPPKDFLEAEQSLSKLNSQLSTRRKVYCSANWDALDFQQQPQGMSQGLREEADPKNIFLVFRKQAPCLLNSNKVRNLNLFTHATKS